MTIRTTGLVDASSARTARGELPMADSHLVICGGGIAGIEACCDCGDSGRQRPSDAPQPRERVRVPSSVGTRAVRPRSIRRYPLEGSHLTPMRSGSWTGWSASTPALATCIPRWPRICLRRAAARARSRGISPFEHAHLFTDRDTGRASARSCRTSSGPRRRCCFRRPDLAGLAVPLYELALMTAERVRSLGMHARITFITPEPRPLKAFGQAAGEATCACSHRPESRCTPA